MTIFDVLVRGIDGKNEMTGSNSKSTVTVTTEPGVFVTSAQLVDTSTPPSNGMRVLT